jgi:membrane protein implicated in regulation of membrane protease activity
MDEPVNNLDNSGDINNQNNNTPLNSNHPEHHKNAKVVLILAFILLVAAIVVLSVFLVQEKSNNEQKVNEVSQSSEENTETTTEVVLEETSKIPEGFEIYEGDSFSFYYPVKWGDPVVVQKAVSDFIGERFYNQNVKYNVDGNYWEYVDEEGFESEGYAGDVTVLRKSKDITVWGFGFGDAGCGKSDPTYLVGDTIVQVTMPIVCAFEDSVSGTFEEGEVEVNLSQDNRINMKDEDYELAVDTILDSIVLNASSEL